MKRILFLFSICCFFASCKSDDSSRAIKETEEIEKIPEPNFSIDTTILDLTENGIPVTFPIPSNSKIEKGTQFIQWRVYLKENAPIEVSMWDDENILSVKEYVESDKELMRLEKGFVIISEDKNGYIYKVDYDGLEDYGFFYVIIKDNRAIEFSPADLDGYLYKLDDIKEMYKYCTYTK